MIHIGCEKLTFFYSQVAYNGEKVGHPKLKRVLCYRFESCPDYKLMECGLKSSHHLKSCPLVGAYGQKVNIQGSRYWVSHVGNNEPRILV